MKKVRAQELCEKKSELRSCVKKVRAQELCEKKSELGSCVKVEVAVLGSRP